MASTSSHLDRPDAGSRLLRILGAEQADALLARSEMATLFPIAHDASQVRAPSSGLRTSCEIYSLTENDSRLRVFKYLSRFKTNIIAF
jgi:hypothetical protein